MEILVPEKKQNAYVRKNLTHSIDGRRRYEWTMTKTVLFMGESPDFTRG